jgi:hypothetical protein
LGTITTNQHSRSQILAIILQHHHRISNSSSITKAVAAIVSQHPLKQHDTIKELMSYPKCRSVTVINNPARTGSNHREVNYINYNNNNNNNNNKNKNNNNNNNNNNADDDLKRTLRYKIIKED